jgi:DNA mismatch endonuclease (patch repair protein)
VLPRLQTAVFVDGCWWHGCPRHGRTKGFTGPNAELWEQKMARTQARDLRATAAARSAGWRVVRLWECEVRADPVAAAHSVLVGPHEPGA